MMTKKTLQLLATTALLAGLGFNTVTASAATVNPAEKDATSVSKQTQASVSLTGGGDEGGNAAGGIHLISAPNVAFTGTLTGDKQTLHDVTFTNELFGDKTKAPKELKDGALVVGNQGYETGWNVQVSADAFNLNNPVAKDANVTKDSKVLAASQLVLDASKVSATDDNNQSNSPLGNKVTLESDGSTGNLPIFQASAGKGIGTWISQFDKATSSFEIAAGNKAGNYTSKLTWTLANTPDTTGASTQTPSTPAPAQPSTDK
ncbi:WxL domain-containing protein [Levilactobacillus tongjiangensis]|uniref:WxL domain-containing protein n=1 Tax=Levilactobacillus tongjiangensis TaxID=2486023 RepID=A0ABW1SQB1_9LACO|nr:WxL domain-containing protein [Levilactobacillus tongjiangensis]